VCSGKWLRRCPFYRVNHGRGGNRGGGSTQLNDGRGGGRGAGSTQVVVGRFKSFGYMRGRVNQMNILIFIVA
jgi:hypothetical protein